MITTESRRHRERLVLMMNHQRQMGLRVCLVVSILLCAASTTIAEDGYRLWLRYDLLPEAAAKQYRGKIKSAVVPGDSATSAAIRSELTSALAGLLGNAPTVTATPMSNETLLVGTPSNSSLIKSLRWENELSKLGAEGYLIRSTKIGSNAAIVVASQTDTGALYGTFHFLRLMQTLQPIVNLNVSESPRLQLRVLDHWDNLDGSVERGYAGHSLWNWNALPNTVDPQLRDYARANASIGINGSVLNNVNANSQILTAEYLKKVAAIASVFRPYGLRVYLSARFSAPIDIGGLKTADPLDAEVAAWWKKKADEIYQLIPDFGGFVVKANS